MSTHPWRSACALGVLALLLTARPCRAADSATSQAHKIGSLSDKAAESGGEKGHDEAGAGFDGGRQGVGTTAPNGGIGSAPVGSGQGVDDFDQNWTNQASLAGTAKPPPPVAAGKDVSRWKKLMETAKTLIIAALACIVLAYYCIQMMRAAPNPAVFAYFKAMGLAACFAGIGLSVAVSVIGGMIAGMGQKTQGIILVLTGGLMTTIIAGMKVGMVASLVGAIVGKAASGQKVETVSQGGAGKEAEHAAAELQSQPGGK